jgi:hypothetical protein
MACIVAMHVDAAECIALLATRKSNNNILIFIAALQASSMPGAWQQVKSEIVEVRECISQHGRSAAATATAVGPQLR